MAKIIKFLHVKGKRGRVAQKMSANAVTFALHLSEMALSCKIRRISLSIVFARATETDVLADRRSCVSVQWPVHGFLKYLYKYLSIIVSSSGLTVTVRYRWRSTAKFARSRLARGETNKLLNSHVMHSTFRLQHNPRNYGYFAGLPV